LPCACGGRMQVQHRLSDIAQFDYQFYALTKLSYYFNNKHTAFDF